MAEPAAEKGPISELIQSQLLQGLKPDVDLNGLIGPTEPTPVTKTCHWGPRGGPREVVPLLQSTRELIPTNFSANCKVVPFQNPTSTTGCQVLRRGPAPDIFATTF